MAIFHARLSGADRIKTASARLGELHLNPDSLDTPGLPAQTAEFQVVVPYVDPKITANVVDRAVGLASGLNATLHLVAVYVAPYPTELRFPETMKEHLTARLTELAERSALPARVDLVVARDRLAGFCQVLRPGSAVLLGTRRRWWWTREERLARALAREGHRVSLLHFN